MRKSKWTFVLFLILGLVAAAILTQLIVSVPSLTFLTKSAELKWQPKADLQVIKYEIALQIKLNLLSILGIASAIWLHRKL